MRYNTVRVVIPVLMAVALLAVATPTRSETSPGWLAAIKADYSKGVSPITKWPGPATSYPAAPLIGKKSFVVIPCSVAATGCAVQAQGFMEAASILRWKTKQIDGKGDPTAQNNAIREAIALHVDGVYEVSIDPHIIAGSIAAAKAARIPVIAGATGTGAVGGLVHEVSLYGEQEGVLLGVAIVARTNGQAHVAIFNDSEFGTVVQRVQGTQQVLAKCPTCKVVVNQDIPVTSLGQPLIARVRSVLQAHPDINVIWAPYDAAASDMVTAVHEAGMAGKVWVGSFNGLPQNLDFIRNGNVQEVDIGEALTWEGWAGVDAFIRLFTGHNPDVNDGVPHQILVKENLPPAGTTNWNSDFDFKTKYKQLWGLMH
jgi:ribose transport system substrate-binding protein